MWDSQAPTTSDTAKAEEVGGCGNSIGFAACAMVAVAGTVTVLKRKKED